jgi:uncharacterized membrane protein
MPSPANHLKDHIEIIAKHEEEFLARRTTSERVGDLFGAFVGSLGFIAFHLAAFTAWILVKSTRWPRRSESPFPRTEDLGG